MATTLGACKKPPGPSGPGGFGTACAVGGSAGLAVHGVLSVSRAELLHLQAVGVVPTVLLGDVVALLALHARHGDLGADVCALASHGATCSRRTTGGDLSAAAQSAATQQNTRLQGHS